jgi:hypothetical protein
VGSDTNLTSNYYQFNFDIGTLLEGWNLLQLDFSDTTKKVGSPDANALQIARFRVNSAVASTDLTDLRWDKFLELDVGAATVAEGGVGNVFPSGGVYTYKITFVTKNELESNAGAASVSITLSEARAQLLLTSIPVSSDPQVISRKIYRTVNAGAFWLFVDRINDNVTTTYTDTTADLSLGSTSPPEAGDLNIDNSPPISAGIIKGWKNTIFLAGDPGSPNNVYFSEDNEPEAFPTLNVVTLDDKVTNIYETYSGLVIETETGKWQVTNDNPDFRFDKVINKIGCVGRRAGGESRLLGWSVDREGMRLYDLNNPIKISEPIRDKFDAFDQVNIELIHTTHSRGQNFISLFAPDSSGVYTGNNYLYQYFLDQQLEQGRWWELQLPSSINILHLTEVEDANGKFLMYGGGNDGMVYHLFDENAKNWTLADGTTEAITTRFATKYMRLGSAGEESAEVTGRVQPREIEIRHSGDGTTWNITIDTANGSDQDVPTDSVTVSIPFASATESLLRYPVPQIQRGEYVRLTLENTDVGVSSSILAVRLYFNVAEGQFPVLTGDMKA